MATYILNSEDKQFIFMFSFSSQDPISLPPKTSLKLLNEPDGLVSDTIAPNAGNAELDNTPFGHKYLEVVVYRNDLPDLYYHFTGNLDYTTVIDMQVPIPPDDYTTSPPIPDNNRCKGQFHLYLNSNYGLTYLWFNVQFGENYEAYDTGNMVQFP